MTNTSLNRVSEHVLETARIYPDRIALVIDDESWTYAELVSAALEVARQLPNVAANENQAITAIMVDRHVSSYIAILAARLSGYAYVPLNVNHPCSRNATILQSSAARSVICGAMAADVLQSILDLRSAPDTDLTIVKTGDQRSDFELGAVSVDAPVTVDRQVLASDLVYILFTSGSTGEPKGVPIRNSELDSFLTAVQAIVDVQPGDRFSQTADLSFDLSVHDVYVCFDNGATLVVPSKQELQMPAAFIRDKEISCWSSVPSLAYQIRLQEQLVPGAFPSLRFSMFCGEALPTVVGTEWTKAACNSRVENWYGPTEATVACSRYVLAGQDIPEDAVPLGKAFSKMELLILNEDLNTCAVDVPGEICLAGPQVASGYLNDHAKTAANFVTLPVSGKLVYKTGDRGLVGLDGEARFLGRVDNQVKVRGYRIELGEIEAALRLASAGKNAVAMAWPGGAEIATSIVAALETDSADIAAIQEQLRRVLPIYMVPSMIFCVTEFPKNTSGKVDRSALRTHLSQSAVGDSDAAKSGLSDAAELLLKAIFTHAPLLSRDIILQSKNLFDAGMDSLAFTSVTMELERHFNLSLDQDTVIQLSEMSFNEIVSEVRGETTSLTIGESREEKPSLLSWLKSALGLRRVLSKPRTNRALQFIESFPGYLAEHGAPDVMAVGSSGIFRGFAPAEFVREAARRGSEITVLNVGLPAVNANGISRISEFIRDQCVAANARVPLIIYEFDPMVVSTTPPRGDRTLGPDFFSGKVLSLSGSRVNLEFRWLIETSGAWNAPDVARQKTRKPNWARERDLVIARAFLGEVEFEQKTVDEWLAGAIALKEIADTVICFVHPVDQQMTNELTDVQGGDILTRFAKELSVSHGIATIPWDEFDLEPDDFLDINHMNARGGREKLSRQLAEKLIS
jgi:amino acid adenylation domain-containing protein